MERSLLLATAKTKIILELQVNTYGDKRAAKTIERLDDFWEQWLIKAATVHPSVTIKVFVPPDWEFIDTT
jgi:hypothetical protein